MKLQVSFDSIDLEKAIALATTLQEHADLFEIGSLLIYKHGLTAIQEFRAVFPQKVLVADVKIADRGKEATQLCLNAGADWVTVLAGANRNVIHAVCTTAHDLGKKVMLDLLDASSLGQSALESEGLGVNALMFHRPATEHTQAISLEQWEMVKGNTKLPIFIATHVTRENINHLIALQPGGIIMGKSATESSVDEVQALSEIIHAN
jgi:3-hexulose-6-phosphate synthase